MSLILLIDDSAVVLAAAQKHLQLAGHEVIAMERAFGAGATIFKRRPDIVILDVEMRALSGEKLLGIIRSTPPISDTVVILHSSSSEEELEALKKRCGADGYLKKGDMALLPKRLERWLP